MEAKGSRQLKVHTYSNHEASGWEHVRAGTQLQLHQTFSNAGVLHI